jgi:hypothetical protein
MKAQGMTVQELIRALQQFPAESEVYVHSEMSLLVECPVIGVVHRTESGAEWQAVLQIAELDEEEMRVVEN